MGGSHLVWGPEALTSEPTLFSPLLALEKVWGRHPLPPCLMGICPLGTFPPPPQSLATRSLYSPASSLPTAITVLVLHRCLYPQAAQEPSCILVLPCYTHTDTHTQTHTHRHTHTHTHTHSALVLPCSTHTGIHTPPTAIPSYYKPSLASEFLELQEDQTSPS